MAYMSIDNPELFFQTVLYTGNGSDNRDITLPGDEDMQPDLVWLKSRSTNNYNHFWTDSVRGVTKYIKSDATSAENTLSGSVKAFNSDGFRVGTEADVNNNTTTYVAWNWKAGGSASSNSDGNITSSVSVNTTAGFSIVSYTGSSANSNIGTVGHGLGSVPKMLIVKDRDATSDWLIFNGNLGNNKILELNDTAAASTDVNAWNNTAPTSSVFTIGDNSYTNANGRKFIAYCFAEKKGFSKFGSYVGNSSTDGTFVYTGFRPAWVMIKRITDTQHWMIGDNKISPFNPTDNMLKADANDAEDTDNHVDFLSNGFKNRITGNAFNNSNSTYVYMAFAESPFVNSNGVPTNAR